jgi:hypothetical protein
MKSKLIIILTLISSTLFAQSFEQTLATKMNQTANINFNLTRNGTRGAGLRNTLALEDYIEYESFYNKEFRPTTITLLSGELVIGDYKYNLENEILECSDLSKNKSWAEIKTFTFEEFNYQPKETFTNIKLLWPENEFGGFLQDVETSSLVKVNHFLQFVPKSWNPSTQTGERNDQVVHEEQTYIKVDKLWVEVPEGKQDFFELFGKYSESLRKYARKNKLKHDNPEDVGSMISWVIVQK